MTTTVRVHPSPGNGLKVRVTVYGRGRPADGNDEFLKSGDPEKSYHVSPNSDFEAVTVEEVEDAAGDAAGDEPKADAPTPAEA